MPTINAQQGSNTTVLPRMDMMQMLMPLLAQRLGAANGATPNGLQDMLAAIMNARANASTGAMQRRPAAERPSRGAVPRPVATLARAALPC